MFTGLVQNLGKIINLKKDEAKLTLCIHSSLPARFFKKGASIAVDGVCLTVEKYAAEKKCFWVTAVEETLQKTLLGKLQLQDSVHLEPPLTLQTPIGGHLVSGHVDGLVTVRKSAPELHLDLPQQFLRFCPTKGSITVLGVSLTIAKKRGSIVEIAIIPETLKSTKLGQLKPGDQVHIEVDTIARYLEALYAKTR